MKIKTKHVLTDIMKFIIFLVIFNGVFFGIFGAEQPLSVWVAYGFAHLAFAAFLFMPKLLRNENDLADIGVTVHRISFVYFVVTFAECVTFILLKLGGYKLCLLTNLIFTSIYLIALLIHTMANEYVLDHQN